MSERKHRSINWFALFGWLILIGWLLVFIFEMIPEIGTVDCDGNITAWYVVLGAVLLLTSLFAAGFFVGLPKNIPEGRGHLIDLIENIYDKLDAESQRDADKFIQKLHDHQSRK